MRSSLSITLLSLLLLILSACSDNEEKPKYTVGVSLCGTTDAWRQALLTDINVEAANYPDIGIQILDADQSSKTQIKQIKQLARQKVDLIVISSKDEDSISTIASEIYRSGIPTIILERKLNTEDYSAFIGADNYETGRSAGTLINSFLSNEEAPHILEIWGDKSYSSAIERHDGFVEATSIHPNIRLTQIEGGWSEKKTTEAIAQLEQIDDIEAVFAHNDVMAIAARQAIEHRDSLLAKRIKFVGIDALPGDGLGLEAVARGDLAGSFYYPTGGGIAIKVAARILKGENYQKEYALTSPQIDQTNAGTIYLQMNQMVEYQRQIDYQQRRVTRLLEEYHFLRNSLVIILTLMLALIFSAIYVVYINRKIRQTMRKLREKKKQVESQKEELAIANHRIEQVTAQKMRFFTNVSHEVKTPLTLILGPLDKMAQDAPPGSAFADDIRIIRKNAERLKRVINQLLDFRKIENNKMDLRVSQIDMVPFIHEVKSCFDQLARGKHIDFTFETSLTSKLLWVDTDKMEKVLANLLSNAFKFTPKGGKIRIALEEQGDETLLSVTDNGKGIAPDKLSKVFERFYTESDHRASGTGIGLHLTSEFVAMHHGRIEVESEPNVRTIFTVHLLNGKSHFDDSNVFDSYVSEYSCGIENLDTSTICQALEKRYPYTILIAEDDPDIREYLVNELSANFEVIATENGAKALEKLNEVENIALLLSDVLMPEMNGFELCRRVKSDLLFSHIPVILLTALSDDTQRLYGIGGGADAYIQKPFRIEEVKLRVIKLLEERERLREQFMKNFNLPSTTEETPQKNPTENLDSAFMRQFMKLVEESFQDPEFNIEKVSEQIGLSRVHLYRKVKGALGVSPTDFLRDYRLKRAADMLREKRYTVSEVAYQTGFTSPAYFTKCFKQAYGVTPTEYVAS